MHPKTEIRPEFQAIDRVLRAGWVGQLKIHGHRAQIHFHAEESQPVLAYTRHGSLHRMAVPEEILVELRRILQPKKGWSAVDAEWLKPKNLLYLFDYLKKDDEELEALTYPERYALLPRAFLSPHIQVLPLLKTADKCWEALQREEPEIEGLVFKSLSTPGFSDTSILRCRKRA